MIEQRDEVIAVLQIVAEDQQRAELEFEAMRVADLCLLAQLAQAIEEDALIRTNDAKVVIADVAIADQLHGLAFVVEKNRSERARRRREELVHDVAEHPFLTPT